ncbi:MAG: YiiX/YebB-like N1pC/P60 family cysteine hydrolase [Bacteroidales bacterium]
MKIVRILKWLILGVITVFILSIAISSIFPGKVRIVDQIRLFAQRPAIKWLGKLKVDELPTYDSQDSLHVNDISFDELKAYLHSIPSGSIFFTRTRNYAISEFIPGMWKHAGIFLGTKEQVADMFGRESKVYRALDSLMDGSEIYVLDSEAEGVRVHPFRDMSNMREESYLTNLAAFSMNVTLESKRLFLKEALKFLGREYDYDWLTEEDNTIYCSELIYHSLKVIGMEIEKRTETLSRIVITPDDLFEYVSGRGKTHGDFSIKINLFKKDGELKNLDFK